MIFKDVLNDEFKCEDCQWKKHVTIIDSDGYIEDEVWKDTCIVNVPVRLLLAEYEELVLELSDKEVELAKVKELYTGKEFDIVFKSDIDFKALYGSTSEKVRKQHAKDVLSDLYDKKASLELSVEFLKSYIGLLKEVIRSKL